MADLRLTDTVDTTETLLQSVRIPRQVVVDHQVGTLQIDTFTGSVSGDQDADFLILTETLLNLPALIPEHAAVDRDHGIFAAKKSTNLISEVAQGVAVLGEDDELLALTVRCEHALVVLQQLGELVPFAILAAETDFIGQTLQILQSGYFSLQLLDGASCGSLIRNVLLFLLHLGGGIVIIIIIDIKVDGGAVFLGTLSEFLLVQAVFQTLTPAVQGLVNCLRRGRQPALQNGQCESDRAAVIAG